MDEESILFGIRNLFSLGNYQTVIKEVSSTKNIFSPEAKLEAQTYLYRSYIAQGKHNLVINDIGSSEEASLKAVKYLASFLSNKNKEEHVQNATALLEEGSNRINSVVQVMTATILAQVGRFDDALRALHSRQKKIEW